MRKRVLEFDRAAGAGPREHHLATDVETSPSDTSEWRKLESNRVFFYVGVSSVLNLLLLALAPSDSSLWRLLAGSWTLWLMTMTWFLHFQRKAPALPFMPVLYLIYFVQFGLPTFHGRIVFKGLYGMRQFETPAITDAAGLIAVGLTLTLVVYYAPLFSLMDQLPRLKLRVPLERLQGWLIAAAMATTSWRLVSYYFEVPRRIASISQLMCDLSLMFVCAIYYLHLRGKADPVIAAVAFGCYTVLVVVALASGLIAPVGRAMIPPFLLYVYVNHKLPYKEFALGLALLVVAQGNKHDVRDQTWRRQATILERAESWFEISSANEIDFGEMGDSLVKRTDQLGLFGYVVDATPKRVSYWDGETYKGFAWAFVPRIVAPDKPLKGLGQTFGHRYSLLAPDDHRTSLNLPQVVEMYCNFGTAGVLIGMTLLGLFYRAIASMVNHSTGGDGPILVGCALYPHLLHIEGDAGLVIFGAFPFALVVFFLLWLMSFMAFGPNHARSN